MSKDAGFRLSSNLSLLLIAFAFIFSFLLEKVGAQRWSGIVALVFAGIAALFASHSIWGKKTEPAAENPPLVPSEEKDFSGPQEKFRKQKMFRILWRTIPIGVCGVVIIVVGTAVVGAIQWWLNSPVVYTSNVVQLTSGPTSKYITKVNVYNFARGAVQNLRVNICSPDTPIRLKTVPPMSEIERGDCKILTLQRPGLFEGGSVKILVETEHRALDPHRINIQADGKGAISVPVVLENVKFIPLVFVLMLSTRSIE